MNWNRRDFLKLGALALSGCALPCGRFRKSAMNASTLRGYGLPLEEQVRAAVAAGYGGYEPWLKDIRAAKAAGRLAAIRKTAEDGGLSFVNGIAFGRWVHPDPAVRAAGLEETKRDMALLAELGCPCIAASMFGVHRPGSPAVPLEAVAERYTAVLDLGRSMGVRPLLECWGHSVNLSRLEDVLEVLRRVNRPDAGVLADVYHTYRGGSSFAAFRRLSADILPVLHVNDYPLSPARTSLTDPDRVWPGDGAAPWAGIFSDLAAAGADPWLSIELFNPAYWRTTPAETLRTGLAKLRTLGA